MGSYILGAAPTKKPVDLPSTVAFAPSREPAFVLQAKTPPPRPAHSKERGAERRMLGSVAGSILPAGAASGWARQRSRQAEEFRQKP